MKTTIALTLSAALSGFSSVHASNFNGQSAISDTTISVSTGRQDLSYVPVVHGSN